MSGTMVMAGDAASLSGGLVLGVAAVAAAGLSILLWRAQGILLPALALMLAAGLAVAYGLVLLDQRAAERQALTAAEQTITLRATNLDGALAASGLACMDALIEMAATCDEVVFARAETVAAARALVRARLMLLLDADALARRAPSAQLAMSMATWSQPLARDPFGLVAVVMREDFSCADGQCAPALALGADAPAVANLANKKFETLYATHALRWNPPARTQP